MKDFHSVMRKTEMLRRTIFSQSKKTVTALRKMKFTSLILLKKIFSLI